jgi:hypothetical protein
VQILTGDPPEEPSVVSIRSRSHDDALEYTHAFLVAYTQSRYRSVLAQALSVAAYELLGNALNYGSVLGEVKLDLVETPSMVALRVSNETVQVRLDMMRSHLERVKKDPEATFLEEMRRSVAGGIAQPMLGIARVVHEAKLPIEVYFNRTRLTVVARTRI